MWIGGRGEQGGRGRGGKESTGSLWRVENQQEVAPLGPGGPKLQLPALLSSHSLIHLGILGLVMQNYTRQSNGSRTVCTYVPHEQIIDSFGKSSNVTFG